MELNEKLMEKGFALTEVEDGDLEIYIKIKKICYKEYVKRHFGEWIDDLQWRMNRDAFYNMRAQSCAKKILLHGETVGFFNFNEGAEVIDGLTIQMLPEAQNQGLGSFYLKYLTDLADRTGKPVILKVFKSNPAQNLYERHGFVKCDDLVSHYLMKYVPGGVL